MRKLALLTLLGSILLGCGGPNLFPSPGPDPITDWVWDLPPSFPTPFVPKDNLMTKAKVSLGRFLFYDKRLSGNETQSCGSCHRQELAFTDGRSVSVGSTGEVTPRNAQGLANIVYNSTLTWANPSLLSLEKQIELPLFGDNPIELGIHNNNQSEILARIKSDEKYKELFSLAFPEQDPISWINIVKATSSFQRSLISSNSKFDKFIRKEASFTLAESRGMNLFFGEKAECFHCHGSFNFNDQVIHKDTRSIELIFHNTGLFNIAGTGAFPENNTGIFELTGNPSDMGKFRAPSLRNIELTAPYMHDGSMSSLSEVLDFYSEGGRNITTGPFSGDGRLNPHKSDLIARINLSPEEKDDIIQFLKTLTDHQFVTNPAFSNPFLKSN
jgi:cytochrome c peroxidase